MSDVTVDWSQTREKLIENLTKAREVYRIRGGAHGTFQDFLGRVCAIGALNVVVFNCAGQAEGYFLAETNLLNDAAAELSDHQFNQITELNDDVREHGGYHAVLDAYDYAIKELENGV